MDPPAELLQGGTPQKRITQKDLFAIANLEVAPSKFVDDSHKSVHMSSLSVATESTVALDNDPGGYSAALEEEIAERTALTSTPSLSSSVKAGRPNGKFKKPKLLTAIDVTRVERACFPFYRFLYNQSINDRRGATSGQR